MESDIKLQLVDDKLYKTLIDFYKEINEETFRNFKIEECYTCVNHFNIWIDIFNYLSPLINDKPNSIFYLRCLEINKHIGILHFEILSGFYYQSIREMRYLLEAIIQAYYIDKANPNTDVWAKLEFLKEIDKDKMMGSKLIKESQLKNKNALKSLYFRLSKHIHPTYEKLNPVYEKMELHENISFEFNGRMFNQCKKFIDQFMDATLFIALSYEPKTIENIKYDQKLLNSLNELNYKLTINYITEYESD